MKNSDLQIEVTVLQTVLKGGTIEINYHIQYHASKLIYMKDLPEYSEFIQKYAFKHKMASTLDEAVNEIKNIYKEGLITDNRVDIIFDSRDIAHISKERRYDSSSLIILNSNCISYNRQLNEKERELIFTELTSLFLSI